jgi:hypothetical protein
MKKKRTSIKVITFAIMLLTTGSLYAQFEGVGNILSTSVNASTADAEKIFEAYLSPYANGMGAALSTGWYNTAKPHKLGGFDLTFSFNVAMIPSADQSYDANDLQLGDPGNGLTVVVDGANSPTAAGKKNAGQTVTYNQNVPFVGDVPIASFNLPKGTGFPYAPLPMVQVGVGLMKESELNFRYSPDIKWGNGSKIGLWGVGIKHGIKQWIPALNKLPVFDLTLQGGYTKMKSTTGLNFQPSVYQDMGIIKPGDIVLDIPGYYDNQELLLDVSNFTANILVSGDFKIICLYGGVGISNSKSTLQLNGNYPFPELDTNSGQLQITEETALTDPIDMTIESSDGSATKPRFNAGFRLKFAVVTINFDYTYANYSVASAGLGISFR